MSSLFAGTAALSAPMDTLVSTDDFVEWFGLATPDAAGTARIETALEIASAECRSATNQQLTVISETVTLRRRSGCSEIVLPEWPVTAVASITIDGQALTADTDYVWERSGVVTLLSGFVTSKRVVIAVTYTHGWDPLPRDLAGVCLSRAKRLYDQPDTQQVEKESLGDWSVTYAAQGEGLTDFECQTIDQYKSWTNGY